MAKQTVLKGDTSRIEYVFIQDSSVTTGAGLTGLVFNSAGLVASYVRTQAARTAITLVTQTVTGAFSSGGFVEVDATNMPGIYRFDIPDAAFATGADKVVVMLKGATNMAPVTLEYQLVDYNPENSTTLGLSALNEPIDANVVAMAAGVVNAAAVATGAIDADAIATDAINEIADGLLDRNMATGTDSGSATVRTVRQALRFLRNKWSITTGTLTVTKEDDTTASWVSTLTSDAAANPVTASDPASV